MCNIAVEKMSLWQKIRIMDVACFGNCIKKLPLFSVGLLKLAFNLPLIFHQFTFSFP